jgi:hypothetical protein
MIQMQFTEFILPMALTPVMNLATLVRYLWKTTLAVRLQAQSGGGSISFDFDYDANTQGNRTAGTNANVTAIAIGLNTGQYVKTTATITRSNANVINFVAAVERNYENPV